MKNKLWADLHLHTKYSDGIREPRQNVVDAAINGIEVIAITDHDTTIGTCEAQKEALNWGIECISGVEISAEKCHILGYNIDVNNSSLQDLLAHSRQLQEEIVERRVIKLQEQGIPLTLELVKQHSPNARIGKINMIVAMMKDPSCREKIGNLSANQIMDSYLKKGLEIAEIGPVKEIDISDAINTIHQASGIAILAHPFHDFSKPSDIDKIILAGIDGIEIQPNYGERNIPFMEHAKQKGLMLTFGSDHHGPYYAKRQILIRQENLVERFW